MIQWHRLENVVIFVIRVTVNWMSCLSSMDNGVRATFLIRPALKIHTSNEKRMKICMWARYKFVTHTIASLKRTCTQYTDRFEWHGIQTLTHTNLYGSYNYTHTHIKLLTSNKLYAAVHCWVRMKRLYMSFCWTSRAYCVCVDSISIQLRNI